MVARVNMSSAGFKVSPPGKDVFSIPDSEMLISSNMFAMRMVAAGSVWVNNNSSMEVNLPVSFSSTPYVFLSSPDGVSAGFSTYMAEMKRENGFFKKIKLITLSSSGARQIKYTIMTS